jgi:hypothetical protein
MKYIKIISDGYYDLDKGREKILALGKEFGKEWKGKLEILKDIYTAIYEAEDQEDMAHWEQEVNDSEDLWLAKIKKNKVSLIVFGVLIFIGLAVALVVGLLFFAAPLFVAFFLAPVTGGFLFIVFIVFLTVYYKNKKLVKNGPEKIWEPDKWPREFPMSSFLDLEGTWWSKMSTFHMPSSGPGSKNNFGHIGEDNLIERLKYSLDDNYICIKNLLVGKKLDADAVIIGPEGIWILESKFVSGIIRLRNKAWTRTKTYYAPGGTQVSEESDLPDYEDQWLREKRAIEISIKDNFPKLFKPPTPLIKGGLVFTHNSSRLDLDSSIKIPYGTTSDWLSFLDQEKSEELLSQQQVFELTNILLNKSKELSSNNRRSAVDVALEVYEESVENMKSFCQEHDIPVEAELEA